MKTIKYEKNISLDKTSILNLYKDAGWTSYTTDSTRLMSAIENSFAVYTAWDGGKLAGFVNSQSKFHSWIHVEFTLRNQWNYV